MENLAPDLKRKRLVIEGFYERSMDNELIREYLNKIAKELGFEITGEPVVSDVEEETPYTLFVSLARFGAAVYVWENQEFISVLLHSCEDFDEERAVELTEDFFELREKQFQVF